MEVNNNDILKKLNDLYVAYGKASILPQFGLYAQGFYGNPGLNLFKDMTH